MSEKFDDEKAKKYLKIRENQKKDQYEKERQETLQKVVEVLKEELKNSAVEVFLVGSITRPFAFTPQSDVDVVLKNFKGDRFDLWSKLEGKIGKSIEIIPFETCNFQEFVLKTGLKIL